MSVVIPTIGRASLDRAVRSALIQTKPVAEIIVVADTDDCVSLPRDDRIMLLRTDFSGSGPARARQLGIEAATGSVIALLDDDDEWHPEKLAFQLHAVDTVAPPWIASSRVAVVGPGRRRRTWPRRLIGPGASISDYLFRFTDLTVGGTALQTSTLCFPIELAREVRWDGHANSAHDEPSWLIEVQRRFPDVRVVQLPDVLSTYDVASSSLSRDPSDRSDEYIEWGLRYLSGESPRVMGDYLCTSPVSAAVAARSLTGVRRALRSALRHGQPGPFAIAYAVLNAARIAGRRVRLTPR